MDHLEALVSFKLLNILLTIENMHVLAWTHVTWALVITYENPKYAFGLHCVLFVGVVITHQKMYQRQWIELCRTCRLITWICTLYV